MLGTLINAAFTGLMDRNKAQPTTYLIKRITKKRARLDLWATPSP
ncbi:hypothetical protein P305_10505 [Xylella fastidiosa subsp. fastidiosa Mus-1]|nr:hypothetical protein P305_10505 [Xylella fastidiosa subsp. fastidiosa Mus-1]